MGMQGRRDFLVASGSALAAAAVTMEYACEPSSRLSSTPVTVTVCAVFQVAAVNSIGTGTYSTASASVTPRTVPGAPTSLTPAPGDAAPVEDRQRMSGA